MAHMQQGPQAAFSAMFGLPAPKVGAESAASSPHSFAANPTQQQQPVAPMASATPIHTAASTTTAPPPTSQMMSLPSHQQQPTALPTSGFVSFYFLYIKPKFIPVYFLFLSLELPSDYSVFTTPCSDCRYSSRFTSFASAGRLGIGVGRRCEDWHAFSL